MPRGQPDGGQWVDEGLAGSDRRVLSDATPDNWWKPGSQLAQNDPDQSPLIPDQRPPRGRERFQVVKDVARWLLKQGGQLNKLVEGASWLMEFEPYISTYFDEPKTLDQLQNGVALPARGYDIHHVVEKTPARKEGFPQDLIEGRDNLVRIPTLKHWQINGWYSTKNEKFDGLTPREYLRGKSWEERVNVGKKALSEHGVLKP